MLHAPSHLSGEFQDEILFDTSFDYIFKYLCNNDDCLLPAQPQTVTHLQQLGSIMADPGTTRAEKPGLNSGIPAVYTYLGQFIDHDITARTDREANFNQIADPMTGNAIPIVPVSPDFVVENLKNGRRPQLDLDSLFGDGPSFSGRYVREADAIFEPSSLRIRIEERPGGYYDLKRDAGTALIADARNDENLMVSQLHAVFIRFYNRIYDRLKNLYASQAEAYSKARKLTRWAYQYVVVNDYLNRVCDPGVVMDTLINGPFYFLVSEGVFMPLEFSVAGFRFGHSMIRPFYRINDRVGEKEIQELLGPNRRLLAADQQLNPDFQINWRNFVQLDNADRPQKARLIDPKLAKGLFQLDQLDPANIPAGSMMARLTQRNLLRGYLLRLPTGQSLAKAMRIKPMTVDEVTQGFSASEKDFLVNTSGFAERSPLWFYILQESAVQMGGEKLGAVGSTLVAETLIGMIKADANSYLNNRDAQEVHENGIRVVPDFRLIQDIGDIIECALSA